MVQQDEFQYHAPSLSLRPPAGSSGPRLWISRIVLWADRTARPIREVKLKPGLNIVWSHDHDLDDDIAEPLVPHDTGKTTLCRLIRYCMGEESFGSEVLERKLHREFRPGGVGAEICIDGVVWAVFRSFDTDRKTFVAVGNLDALAIQIDSLEPSGIEPIRTAIDAAFAQGLSEFRTLPKPLILEVALAFATRDHDCAFSDVLSWRSPHNNSGKQPPMDQRANALHTILGLTMEEDMPKFRGSCHPDLGREYSNQLKAVRKRAGEKYHGEFRASKDVSPDLTALLDDATRRDIELQEEITRVDKLLKTEIARRDAFRADLASCDVKLGQLNAESRFTEAQVVELRRLLQTTLSHTVQSSSICSLTGLDVCAAMRQGCLVLQTGCDPASSSVEIANIQARIESFEEKGKSSGGEVTSLYNKKKRINTELKIVDRAIGGLEKEVNARMRDLAEVQSRIRLCKQFDFLTDEVEEDSVAQNVASNPLPGLQERRDRCVENSERLREIFRQVIGEILGREAEGLLDFKKPDLGPQVRLHGESSGTVTTSMSVLCLDFAALVMSIESRTFLPAFTMHDCPRVHDMSQTLYWAIFRFVRKLEIQCGEAPLFQYIITTSSAPGKDRQDQSSVALNLDGRSPNGAGRLFERIL